jgi:hypothetical protein
MSLVNNMKRQFKYKMGKAYIVGFLALMMILSCTIANPSTPVNDTQAPSIASPISTNSVLIQQTTIPSPTPTESPTPEPSYTPTVTPVIMVESLKAMVTADLLSCRYGPGSEYLFLYGLRKGANIKLIGRTEGNHWVYVDGKNKCWVNEEYIDIAGDKNTLPIVYPGIAKLPISPYYPPTTVLKVVRNKNVVSINWLDIPLRAGDEEDESMQHYIIELWRCESGNFFFDPQATNELSFTFTDEPGCSEVSHGQIFVQEKHGFAGPVEIPWPPYK